MFIADFGWHRDSLSVSWLLRTHVRTACSDTLAPKHRYGRYAAMAYRLFPPAGREATTYGARAPSQPRYRASCCYAAGQGETAPPLTSQAPAFRAFGGPSGALPCAPMGGRSGPA